MATADFNELERAARREMAFAVVQGEPLTVLPQDLYIPPDALEIILEAFEGPLDLLLYLIKRQNLDILDIPIAAITRQYVDYIGMMDMSRLDLAADYLVMAATLAEIKSRMLLPCPVECGDEDDPRAALVQRLQEYERFKRAAEDLNALPRLERDLFSTSTKLPRLQRPRPPPAIALRELLLAFRNVVHRAEMFAHHNVERETLSVHERMSSILAVLKRREFVIFTDLFNSDEGRMGVVVTLLAMLTLIKASMVDIVQASPFAPIHLQVRRAADSAGARKNNPDTH